MSGDWTDKILHIAFNKSSNVRYSFHLHNHYEIYFFVSGNANFLIENKMYKMEYGNIVLLNDKEIHKPSVDESAGYERIVIQFDPTLVSHMNTESFDLLKCFVDRERGEHNLINCNVRQCEEFLRIAGKMLEAQKEKSKGDKIIEYLCLVELLVFINRLYEDAEFESERDGMPDKISQILEYIEDHLESDLTLEELSVRFYLHKNYLCRQFKKYTGSGVHEYILYKRIAKAKEYLSKGKSVTEACNLCGFNDYSNFLRAFKKTVGKSPGKYKSFPSI